MNRHPSEIHQDLTLERINEIGFILAQARHENLEAVDVRDDGWSIGCRAYTWCRSELIFHSACIPYLTIKDPSLKFIFKIGQVEVSIYKGASTKPNKNIYSRTQSYPELRQMALLDEEGIPEELVWAYAIETDLEGKTTNIEFFGMGGTGNVIASHIVPIHQIEVVAVAAVGDSASMPVELPPAAVSLSNDPVEKAKKTNEKNRSFSGR